MDERKHALVIGINEYRNGIPRLVSAVPDAEAVAATLATEHGYEAELLLDAAATVGAIEGFFAGPVAAALSDEDSFVLYYAGHGVAADAEGKGPQGFLLPQDADRSDPATWFGMDQLREALGALRCRHVLLVLDCCYAGAIQWASTRDIGFVKRPLYVSQYERYRKGVAWHVLTSASHDETADDAAPFTRDRDRAISGGHSPFARALIDGLSSGDADSSRGGMKADGVITATELYQYIYEKVALGDRQTPGIFPLKEDNKGEFVFKAPGVDLNLEPDPPLDDANNPWLGLGAYSAAERELFFGRNAATAELLERVGGGRFVAVVGASGSGKTSLVRAGLLPALEGWLVVESAPANLDEARKQAAAAPGGGRRLLVIDRFEELFAQPDGEARARMLDGLHELVASEGGPTVVVALRSDFEPQAAAALGELWAAGRYAVPEFGAEELREVILGPARAKAVFFEPAKLVDTLILTVNGRPGGVPLLSLTLSELYQQARLRRRESSDDRMLTAEDDATLGGPVGVLHRRATELFDQADAAEKETIRRVLLRFASQENDGVKPRRVYRDELDFGDTQARAVSAMLDSYIADRVLVAGSDGERGYVEPAHEALVTGWDKQLEWLARSGSQKVIRDAWIAADDWEHKDGKRKSSRYLWNHNPHLLELERREHEGELNGLERDFRAASSTRKRVLRRRLIAITLAVMAALLAFGIYATIQRQHAITKASIARAEALATRAQLAIGEDSGAAFTLAQRSRKEHVTPGGDEELLAAAQRPGRRSIATGHSTIFALGLLADGRIVTGSGDGELQVWDPARPEGAEASIATGHRTIESLGVLGDGRIVTGSGDGQLQVWDPARPERAEVSIATGHNGLVTLRVLADGRIATGSYDGQLQLWNPARPERAEVSVATGPSPISALAELADGRIATGSGDGQLQIWDPAHPALPDASIATGHQTIWSLGVLADGRIATGSHHGQLQLWDTAQPKHAKVSIATGHGDVRALGVMADGRIATGSGDGELQLWDPARAKPAEVSIATGHGTVSALAVLAHGWIATGGSNGQLQLWDPAQPTPPDVSIATGHGAVWALGLLADRWIATGSEDGQLELWDPAQPRRAAAWFPTGHGRVLALAVTGGRIATGSGDGQLQIWDPRQVKPAVMSVTTGAGPVRALGVLAERFIAAGTSDGQLQLWDPTRAKDAGRSIATGPSPVLALGMLPKVRIATGSADGQLQIWGQQPEHPEVSIATGHGSVSALAVLADGRIATGGDDGQLQIWDPEQPRQPEVSIATGHGTIWALGVLADGRLATGSQDGQLQIWDLAHPALSDVSLATGHGRILALAVLPGGRIATGSEDGQLEVRGKNALTTRDDVLRISEDWPLDD